MLHVCSVLLPLSAQAERGPGGEARGGEGAGECMTELPSLRPLGLPQSIRVRLDAHGLPGEVARATRGAPLQFRAVEQVDEAWRIAEEWWRPSPSGEGLARTYYRVLLDDGSALTLFQDDEDGQWYEQRY
jgi:hypothetical protein